jgi:hypothetical protein
MEIEELSQYGKTLSGLPREAIKQQEAIVFREIRKKFGLLGMVPFFIRVLLERRRLIKNYPAAYQEALKLSKDTAKEITMLIAVFNLIASRSGRDNAYEFVQNIFQKVAVYSMPAFYQINELVKCEGDVFENFKKFNIAWFNAMNEEGTWIVDEMKDEKDELTIVVTKCANCVLGEAFDCPEIAKLGCDHDLAGFPLIVDKVNVEFRRPHTLAKGDEYCDFHFHRKGKAPDTEHLNK